MLKDDFRMDVLRPGARFLRGAAAAALIAAVAGVAATAASPPQSGPAKDGNLPWFILQPSANPAPPRPQMTPVPIAQCAAESAKLCSGQQSEERNCLAIHYTSLSSTCQAAIAASAPQAAVNDRSGIPTCIRSVICGPNNGQGIAWRTNPNGLKDGVGGYIRVQWKSTPVNAGYTASYPYTLPAGAGGAVSIAVDSKDNLWVYQRAPVGVPSLTKFGPDRKMLFTLGDDVIGHSNKAHGMNVDAQDNVYIADPSSSIIQKISPQGKVLATIGTRGKRGDWDEAKGQRLLWQPISLTFAPNGDMYIAEGHGNESPNDTQSGDPANISGASRVIRLDKNGKFISQWYGNVTGPGKFAQVHDIAVDPKNGDVWLGDRELYRFVIYSAEGEFIRAIQMRNLTCNIAFDKNGDPWMGTGGDGQLVKIDRDGKILEAVGNGPGNGEGQVGETGYIRWDSKGNMYMGATSQPRVTVWTPPKKG
jgi:hypothetical protein